MKKIMTKSELKQLIYETVEETLRKMNFFNEKGELEINEGVDVDSEEFKVGFNPNHQKYVDTNDPWNPQPIYNTIDGKTVISIFKRKTTDDGKDGNPLIYALKNFVKVKNDTENQESKKDWELRNPSFDIFGLLRRFVAVTKELKEDYDVIITTPSSNPLNTQVLYRIKRIIPHENAFEDFFTKYKADVVYEDFIDSDWLEKTFPDESQRKKMHSRIYNAICKMNLPKKNGGNDKIFSYKFLRPTELRNAIIQSMYISDDFTDEITYGKFINDKKVLVIDDTITSGKTISDSANAIKEMYAPKSITFLTLFSPLETDSENSVSYNQPLK